MTLNGYFTQAFAGRFLAVLVSLASLLQLLDLLDKASVVLERGRGAADLLTYTGLRLPLVLNQLVPLSVLVAALGTFLTFARNNEIVALRSAGASPMRLLRTLLPAVAAIAALHLALLDRIVPRAEQALLDWWALHPAPSSQNGPSRPVWFRAGPAIASAAAVRDGGRRLEGVTIVPRDEHGQATGRVTAREALWEIQEHEGGAGGLWTLIDADTLTLANSTQKSAHRDRMPWPDGPVPENIAWLGNPTGFLSVHRLRSILNGDWSGVRERTYYETQLQRMASVPVSSLVMLLLAQPALHGLRRSRRFGSGMTAGLVLGLLFLLFQGLLSALAEANTLPPALAVWLPPAIFICIGGAILLFLEE